MKNWVSIQLRVCREWKASRRKRGLAWRKKQMMLVRLMCQAGQCARNVFDRSLATHWRLCETACIFHHKKMTERRKQEKRKLEKRKTLSVRSATCFLASAFFRLQLWASEGIVLFIERSSLSRWAGSVNLAGLRRVEVLKPKITGPDLLDMPWR